LGKRAGAKNNDCRCIIAKSKLLMGKQRNSSFQLHCLALIEGTVDRSTFSKILFMSLNGPPLFILTIPQIFCQVF